MKTALAMRHVHFEDLGTLEPLLASAASKYLMSIPPWRTCRRSMPLRSISSSFWASSGRPLLGICRGAQLIARALGAAVTPMGYEETGFGELTPARPFLQVLQWTRTDSTSPSTPVFWRAMSVTRFRGFSTRFSLDGHAPNEELRFASPCKQVCKLRQIAGASIRPGGRLRCPARQPTPSRRADDLPCGGLRRPGRCHRKSVCDLEVP